MSEVGGVAVRRVVVVAGERDGASEDVGGVDAVVAVAHERLQAAHLVAFEEALAHRENPEHAYSSGERFSRVDGQKIMFFSEYSKARVLRKKGKTRRTLFKTKAWVFLSGVGRYPTDAAGAHRDTDELTGLGDGALRGGARRGRGEREHDVHDLLCLSTRPTHAANSPSPCLS